MLGDNREVSWDSRYWEDPYITVEDIRSKVLCVIPFHKLPWF
jgi:signal peptidase I